MLPILAGFSITKFLGGFALWKGEAFGKILFYAIIILVAITIYHKAFKATTTIVKPGQVIIQQQNCKDKVFLGVQLWSVKIGASIK